MKKYYKVLLGVLFVMTLAPSWALASIDTNLSYGSKGKSVIELQEFLIAKGYLKGITSGNFFSQTKQAVVRYQKANSINPTGYVGPQTRERIRRDLIPVVKATSSAILPTSTITTTTTDQTTSSSVQSSPSVISLTIRMPKEVLRAYMTSATNCDFTVRDTLVTSASNKILSRSCTAWKNEVACYSGARVDDVTEVINGDKAVVYKLPFSHEHMPPFMFVKESGEWKIRFDKMAEGIVFGGSGTCAYPWSWKGNTIRNEYCNIDRMSCLE